MPALNTSETSSRKPMPSTMANEKKRYLIIPIRPEPLVDLTPQTAFSESRNSPKTPDAPNNNVRKPTTAAVIPCAGLLACCSNGL